MEKRLAWKVSQENSMKSKESQGYILCTVFNVAFECGKSAKSFCSILIYSYRNVPSIMYFQRYFQKTEMYFLGNKTFKSGQLY